MRRLFIAINLPDDIKKEIKGTIEKFEPLLDKNIRILPPENWHLTLTFLGYQPEEGIGMITKSIKETVEKFSSPFIEFLKIIYAPPARPPRPPKFFEEKLWRPRMIWLTGSNATSRELDKIKNQLENLLEENGVKFKRENRPYNAHLTLDRFDRLVPAKIDFPKISDLNFKPQSIDLMESHLKRAGAVYEILLTSAFKKGGSED